jgi:DNA-binding HxlR family transcriptional regulator
VEYSLTQKGLDLLPILDSMRNYGRRWLCEEVSQAPEHRAAVAAEHEAVEPPTPLRQVAAA